VVVVLIEVYLLRCSWCWVVLVDVFDYVVFVCRWECLVDVVDCFFVLGFCWLF